MILVLKDQESAGIDIVSGGELRRDNNIDYFLARIPGVQIPVTALMSPDRSWPRW
jgi:5-methyltetrahydropteroyltriglutamate--homocysteine methyltransferase